MAENKFNVLQDILNPKKPASKVDPLDKGLPSVGEKDFGALKDQSLQSYVNSIPSNEWEKILKYLLLGLGASAIGGLTYVMGRYVQFLKENFPAKKDTSSSRVSWSTRAGKAIGEAARKYMLRPPEVVGKAVEKGVKSLGAGLQLAKHLMRTKEKTPIKDLERGINRFKMFWKTK